MRLDENGRWVSDDGAYVWDEPAQTWRLANVASRSDPPMASSAASGPAVTGSAATGSAAAVSAGPARPGQGSGVESPRRGGYWVGAPASTGENTTDFRVGAPDAASPGEAARQAGGWTPPDGGSGGPAPTGPIFTGEAYTGPTPTAGTFVGYQTGPQATRPGPSRPGPARTGPGAADLAGTGPFDHATPAGRGVDRAGPTADPPGADQLGSGAHPLVSVPKNRAPGNADPGTADLGTRNPEHTDPLAPRVPGGPAAPVLQKDPQSGSEPPEHTEGIPRRTVQPRQPSAGRPAFGAEGSPGGAGSRAGSGPRAALGSGADLDDADADTDQDDDEDAWYNAPASARRPPVRRMRGQRQPGMLDDPSADWNDDPDDPDGAGSADGDSGGGDAGVAADRGGLPGRLVATLRRPVVAAVALAVALVAALGVAGFIVLGGDDAPAVTGPVAAGEGRYDPKLRQTYINECLNVSDGNERFCTCTLTKLEGQYTQDQYLALNRDVSSDSSQRIVREIYTACRNLR
ncbi:hypothetical protein [Parafrankia elaeagni]|uniref:hypothetical protein n=1 Tax=Parafrankia elaeagni TaxID=222534 RepID=UPI0003A8848F|nr:hypothetical protein [Parafrankia elaeagni]